MNRLQLAILALLPFAAAPLASAATPPPTRATATIVDVAGRPMGKATFSTGADGAVQLQLAVAGFDHGPGGDHGLHVHAIGKCEGPAFSSAGGHLNPGAKQHGHANPLGAHAGDLPNIQFYPDGSGAVTARTTAFTIASLLDADGSALMIHAAPDDQVTDPSGNSGARIGCGLIVASPAAP